LLIATSDNKLFQDHERAYLILKIFIDTDLKNKIITHYSMATIAKSSHIETTFGNAPS
jgi:hypothetical protein